MCFGFFNWHHLELAEYLPPYLTLLILGWNGGCGCPLLVPAGYFLVTTGRVHLLWEFELAKAEEMLKQDKQSRGVNRWGDGFFVVVPVTIAEKIGFAGTRTQTDGDTIWIHT